MSILCSNCHSHLDELVAESSLEELDYEELLQRNRTNRIPRIPQERSHMLMLVDEANNDLETCESAILELEEQLAQLRLRRADIIRRRISPSQSLLSPIRKLPPEVLTSIFTSVGLQITVSLTQTCKLRSAAFGLTWVCTWWRSLILSESKMWSCYEMDFRSVLSLSSEFIEFIRECMEVRARSAMLQFSLAGVDQMLSTNRLQLLDVVIPSAQRWRSAAFKFFAGLDDLREMLQVSSASSTKDYPYLESLEIPIRVHEISIVFRGFPRLRRLKAFHLDHSDAHKLSNLTSLEVQEFIGYSITQLLVLCPALETLSVWRFERAPSIPLPSSYAEYHHTRLSHLYFQFGDSESCNIMFHGLYLPALTHLSVTYKFIQDGRALHKLAETLTRSRCSLQRITVVHGPRFTQEMRAQFLNSISSVIAPNVGISTIAFPMATIATAAG
ncbi:hypothetical protein D9757_010916 [Collybiopsis confluens]|uniref:F-box domain-containing protein n=1 Tax=Collybiopsis confluens TaxID=2823264 RepID=A0A8H5LQB2_9AGAR|nr:hypothetical protein D9757_010916 [Collybiopsis confluens]